MASITDKIPAKIGRLISDARHTYETNMRGLNDIEIQRRVAAMYGGQTPVHYRALAAAATGAAGLFAGAAASSIRFYIPSELVDETIGRDGGAVHSLWDRRFPFDEFTIVTEIDYEQPGGSMLSSAFSGCYVGVVKEGGKYTGFGERAKNKMAGVIADPAIQGADTLLWVTSAYRASIAGLVDSCSIFLVDSGEYVGGPRALDAGAGFVEGAMPALAARMSEKDLAAFYSMRAEDVRDKATIWGYRIALLLDCLDARGITTRSVRPAMSSLGSRRKHGKKPLYSYHVLEIGGKPIEALYSGAGGGRLFRSHLRRGHWRHFEDGARTWVRGCYVHGNVPGFVSKDYSV